MHERAEIRQAILADLVRVETIVREAYGVYVPRLGRKPSTMEDDYRKHIEAGCLWIVELDGQAVGFLVLHVEADHAYLDNVAVTPAQQGQGIGRRLIAFAEERARRAGLSEIRLTTHPRMTENLVMYAHLGFVETGRTEKGRLAFVHLCKRL